MNRLTKIIIFVLVGVILTVAVMTPIMEDMSERVVTSHNQQDTRYKLTSFFQEETIENINDKPFVSGVPLQEIASNSQSRVITDDFILEAQYYTEYNTHGAWTLNALSENIPSTFDKIVFKKGTYTMYNDGTEIHSGEYEIALIPAKNGDYVSYISSSEAYVNADSEIYIYGNGPSKTLYSGNIVDGMEVLNTDAETTPTATISSTLIQESSGLYRITGFSTTETYKGMYIPIDYYEITAQDEAIRSIISVLPLMAVLMILIAAGYGVMSYVKNNNRGGDI